MPTTEDDGKSITCRAENPDVNGLYLETAWKLDVVCKFFFIYLVFFSFGVCIEKFHLCGIGGIRGRFMALNR